MSDEARTETLDRREPIGQRRGVIGVLHFEGPGALVGARPVRETLVIGRGAECDVVLEDGKLSRRHLELAPEGGGLRARDLESRNGTWLDGARLAPDAVASVGAVLRLGLSLFVVVDDTTVHRGARASREGGLVGGARIERVRARVRELARASVPLCIRGETGTGKELAARMAHDASGRSGPFVEVNCAALPGDLLESELFGHAKGAFSGADRARRGLFRSAHGGTLFLDEIGELSPSLQAKLLRVLEDGEVRAVGEDHASRVDVRVVAATHRDLSEMVASGRFREDLHHRLAGATVTMPTLEERREDVPALARHFLGDARVSIGVDALERLAIARWPGNVRQLRNAVLAARAIAESRGDTELVPEHFELPEASRPARAARRSEEDAQRTRLEEALRAAGGNVTAAAAALGMRRATVYEQMTRLGIDPSSFR